MSKQPIFYLEPSCECQCEGPCECSCCEDTYDKKIQDLLDKLNDTTNPRLVSIRDFFKKAFGWIKKIFSYLPIKINKKAVDEMLEPRNLKI